MRKLDFLNLFKVRRYKMGNIQYSAFFFAVLIVFVTAVGFDWINCERCSLFMNYYVIGVIATVVNLIELLISAIKVAPNEFHGFTEGYRSALFKTFCWSLLFSGIAIGGAFLTVISINKYPFHDVSNVSLFGYSYITFILSWAIVHPLRFLVLLVTGKF